MKIGSATVRVPGVCGELVQGMLDDDYYLVTCPIDYFSRVQVDLFLEGSPEVGPPVVGPEDSPKAVAAVSATLAHLGRQELSARLAISNPIPRGKGMGSSSADVVAAIAATGLALDQELSPETVGRLALMEEPTDGVMFPGIALFDHRQGRADGRIGPSAAYGNSGAGFWGNYRYGGVQSGGSPFAVAVVTPRRPTRLLN